MSTSNPLRFWSQVAKATAIAAVLGPLVFSPLLALAQDAAAPTPAPSASIAAPASQAPAAPAAVTPAPALPEHPASTENPYGIDSLWRQGDIVARGTLVILLTMSIASWFILLSKLLEQSRFLGCAKEAKRAFPAGTPIAKALGAMKASSPFRYVAHAGSVAADQYRGALSHNIDANTWLMMAVERATDHVVARLQGGLAVLATVGSTAPFVGLFGTVWGIYHALTAIGIAGQASIDKVAGPVGEALIMTAVGLAVAVPAVLGYNLVVRRNKACVDTVRQFGADLHTRLLAEPLGAPQIASNSGMPSHRPAMIG
jgi:biopolymer transport protein ExbB